MQDHILIGRGESILAVPDTTWRQHLAAAPQRGAERLSFMNPEHHLVRNFVVRELPGHHGLPWTPAEIAATVALPVQRIITLLDDLERHLFFLVRNRAGEVSWAFPVTVAPTPHRVHFSSGEQLFAA